MKTNNSKNTINNIVYDTETGKPATVPSIDDLQQNIISGKLAFKKKQDINVVDPDGKSGTIPSERVSDALKAGYRLESQFEQGVRDYVKQNEGIAGDLKVALDSFGNQLAFGIPDIVYDHTASEQDKAKVQALKKSHELANTVGGVGGFTGSLFVGGPLFKFAAEAGQAVEAGILGERALASAGVKALEQKLILSGAEKAAAKAAAPSLARTTAAAAAKYGVEGAIISAPQAITEAAFGDFNKSAEHLLAGVGGNIVLGGTVSGLGALGKGFYNLSKRAMRETALGQYISEGFSPEMAALSAAGLERGSARKLGKDKLDDIGNTLLTQPLMSDGKPVVSSGMSGKVFRDRVEAFKNESVEQMEKILTDLDAAREVKTSVGSVGNTEIKRKADELFSAGDFKSAVDLLKKEKIQIQKSKVFDLSFEDITKKLDELSEKYKYAIDTSERLAVSKVKRTVDAFAAEGKTSFKDFHNLKVKLGKNTQWSATDTKSLTQLKQDMYGVVNSELDKSINKVEELYGDEFAGVFKDFQTAKKGYAAATEVSRLLETEKARELGNKVFGLTDTILGSGGLAFGGAAFGAGGSFGALLLPILGVAGKKLLESTWFKTAYASGVKNIGENGAISLLTNAYKHSKEKINEGALIALGLAPMDVIKSVPKVATYKAISEFLGRDIHSELKQDRQKLAEELYTKLDKQTLDMSGTIDKTSSNADVLSYTGAPSVAQEFAKKQIEVLDYLKTVLPKIDKQYNLFEGKKSHEITDQDLHRFEKSLRILANPFSIIQSIQTNTITKDEIQALQAIYPNIYESFKNRIIQVASEKKPNLSFQDRMRLSILLGVPLDPSVGASGRYQASFGSATQSPPPGGSVRPSSLDVKPATLNTPVSNLMFKNK